MKYLDVWCALGVAVMVYFHHLLVAGWNARFELHPAVVLVFVFFAVFGAYRLVFGSWKDRR